MSTAIADILREWRQTHSLRRQGTDLRNRQESLCRDCGGYIVWVRTEKGKMMPLDPFPDEAGRFVLTRWVDSGGRRVVHWLRDEELEELNGNRYDSHYGDCPARQQPKDERSEEERNL